ncbi:hypothetical protein HDU91_004013 [Kappamyces sp. JEL0680]|nr:hypothetical protein HDU91_004013 [Kappamyces sp. JEL0680]
MPASFQNVQVGWKRKIEYVMPLSNPLGPKSSKCFIVETVKNLCHRLLEVNLAKGYVLAAIILVALDTAVPDGIRTYQTKLASSLVATIARGKKSSLPGSGASAKPDSPPVTTEVTAHDTGAMPSQIDLQKFVEFIKTTHVGVAIAVFMVLLLLLNLFLIFFLVRINSKLNLLLLQQNPPSNHADEL